MSVVNKAFKVFIWCVIARHSFLDCINLHLWSYFGLLHWHERSWRGSHQLWKWDFSPCQFLNPASRSSYFVGRFLQSHFLFVCFTWKSTFPYPKPGLPFSIALIKCILFKWNVLRVSALDWPRAEWPSLWSHRPRALGHLHIDKRKVQNPASSSQAQYKVLTPGT